MTASEAKQVMRVAIRGVLCKRDEEIDPDEVDKVDKRNWNNLDRPGCNGRYVPDTDHKAS